MPKFETKKTSFRYFWRNCFLRTLFSKKLLSYLTPTSFNLPTCRILQNMPKFETKNALFEYFGLEL